MGALQARVLVALLYLEAASRCVRRSSYNTVIVSRMGMSVHGLEIVVRWQVFWIVRAMWIFVGDMLFLWKT